MKEGDEDVHSEDSESSDDDSSNNSGGSSRSSYETVSDDDEEDDDEEDWEEEFTVASGLVGDGETVEIINGNQEELAAATLREIMQTALQQEEEGGAPSAGPVEGRVKEFW